LPGRAVKAAAVGRGGRSPLANEARSTHIKAVFWHSWDRIQQANRDKRDMDASIYILIALGLIALFVVVIFNRLVALRQAWKRAFADIDVQLKQRHDLIPNLVETVKGYAAHESGVFTKVTEARASAMRASGVAEKSAAEGALSGALANLMAVAENYPQLKANENFRLLQDELADLENKIAAARRFLNNAVAEYNVAIQQFPAVLFAGVFGFTPAQMFELDEAERANVKQPPKVSFGA
jgi:LemA protein